MSIFQFGRVLSVLVALLLAGFATTARAGGSGLNTLVVINQNSTNSIELGNYYCEKRSVPPENVLRISWTGGNTQWTSNDYQVILLTPLLDLIQTRGLNNQIHYVVLSMDIPFQTTNTGSVNSTTSALFYGLKSESGSDWRSITNSYATSEAAFSNAKPESNQGYSFLTTMITGTTLARAKQVVDQGVAGDATFPGATVILAKSDDYLRNLRYRLFDNAIFNTRLRGNYSVIRTNSNNPYGHSNLLGYQTGLAGYNVSPNTFVPGAMADSMTSFGGIIFGFSGQTSLFAFLNAGAAGSFGTVTEPQPSIQKFPSPQNYFYQARGFSLAECYYQSLEVPFQGLIVGEPLSAPFRVSATGSWTGISSNSVLSGIKQAAVRFQATNSAHPLQQVDLFLDGKYLKTITNIHPSAGNQFKLTLNGHEMTYIVPAAVTPSQLATNLAAMINLPANTNAAHTIALPTGDRVELRAIGFIRPAPPGGLRFGSGAGANASSASEWAQSLTGTAPALTTWLIPSRDGFLKSPNCALKACSVNGPVQIGTWLRMVITKTNGSTVSVTASNQDIGGNVRSLTSALFDAINAAPQLQGPDGVYCEDLVTNSVGAGTFNLLARSPGNKASTIKVVLSSSASLAMNPSTAAPLTDNLSDLLPRNHLYIAAGQADLNVPFTLDTTALPDGHHELTAVAYEGSNVRTQTKLTIPVRVQNSSLAATMTLTDLPATAPASGTYHIQATANANNVASIRLFSTGGELAASANQATSTFAVNGATLGAGLHPFYSVVETTAGKRYRTETRWVRLTY